MDFFIGYFLELMLNKKCTSSDEANKISFEAWLKKKQEQLERDKDLSKKIEQFNMMDKTRSTPEERSKAFKELVFRFHA